MAPLLETALRATLVLLIAGAVTMSMRRATAAARHLVWTLTFGGLIAVPVAASLLPAWRIPVHTEALPDAWTPAPTVTVTDTPSQAPRTAGTPAPRPRAERDKRASVAWWAPTDWTLILGWVWLGGVAVTLGVLLIGLLRVWMLARTAVPETAESWTRLVRALSAELGLHRHVTLLRAAGPAMPMTWGLRRPVILLPAGADSWPEAERRQVLVHELAHVRRHDVLTQLIARIVCAAYWFHPLVWLAAARLRVERERACDDLVLRSGARPSDYAGHLLEIARSFRVAPAAGLASVAMARPSQLALRLLDVLDAHRRRGALPQWAGVPAALAALVVVVPLATAVPVRRAVSEPRPEAAQPLRAEHPAPAPLPTVTLTVASRDTLGCELGTSPRRHSSVHVNDGTAVHLTIGRCDVVFTAEGEFTFNDDFTDIATLSRGGEVVVELDDGRTLRRLAIRPAAGDALERKYTVDREVRPFDADARAWLAQTLTLMFRSSGLAAQQRAQWFLERRGINGLVDEIALLQGDYTRRQYYDVALASGKLDDSAIERLVIRAGQEIGSDYEVAELLINVARSRQLTAGMQAGFVKAAGTIQSDYERRRVLDAALERNDLSTPVAAAMLEAAGDIQSDYELAELLIGMQRVRPMDDAVREAFFAAANTLQSDYEHRRVLTAVIGGRTVSRAMLYDALESAQSLNSDYELAELLTDVARLNVIDSAASRPFLLAAKTIQSDHEAGRTLAALAARSDLPPVVLRELLQSAKTIQSDYELAELLIAIAGTQRIDQSVRPVFEAAAATIQSQYEYDRVMGALGRAGRGRAQLD